MKEWKRIIVSAIFCLLPLSAAVAENYGFLSNSAMSYFTKQDWQIFNKTQEDVLNHGKNGVKVFWKNPKSGSHGYMVPSAAPSKNGMVCRYLAFFNTANLINGKGSYKFCKSNNKWMIY
jgi:surface antigen